MLTDWFRDAGYFTANVRELPAGARLQGHRQDRLELHPRRRSRSTRDRWADLKAHQPFFAQINFQETHRAFHAPKQADPAKVEIPPYYPDHPVTRDDWAAVSRRGHASSTARSA